MKCEHGFQRTHSELINDSFKNICLNIPRNTKYEKLKTISYPKERTGFNQLCTDRHKLCTDRHRQRRSPNLAGNKLSKFGDFWIAIDGEFSAFVLRANSAAHDIFSSVLLISVCAW
jgi:hypothetical protein